MQRVLILLTFIVVIVGCSNNTNKVERLETEKGVVTVTREDDVTRFRNLYTGKQTYPVTCERDCYPPSLLVDCESGSENCKFVGEQVKPQLNTGFNIKWFGHASFAITTESGERFLFDPVTKQFDWPVDLAFDLTGGFYRNEPTGFEEQDWRKPDAVMYSHIHYDHFNKSDIAEFDRETEFLVPLGFAEYFEQDNFKITEMSWFAERSVGETKVNFVPAHHFSSRIFVPFIYEDNDKTLWGGWLLESAGKTLFFAGDTGYSPHFKDIQKQYGDIDVCLIPIASYYHPENGAWYRHVHTTPEDSLQAAQDLNCNVTIPWGYGNNTWKMGDHTSHSALLRLLHMKKELNSDVELYIMNEGDEVSL